MTEGDAADDVEAGRWSVKSVCGGEMGSRGVWFIDVRAERCLLDDVNSDTTIASQDLVRQAAFELHKIRTVIQ